MISRLGCVLVCTRGQIDGHEASPYYTVCRANLPAPPRPVSEIVDFCRSQKLAVTSGESFPDRASCPSLPRRPCPLPSGPRQTELGTEESQGRLPVCKGPPSVRCNLLERCAAVALRTAVVRCLLFGNSRFRVSSCGSLVCGNKLLPTMYCLLPAARPLDVRQEPTEKIGGCLRRWPRYGAKRSA